MMDEEHSAISVTGDDERHRRRGNTPLLCNVIQHHYCVIFFLLQRCVGLDVLVFGEEGRRPLHCMYDFHRCHGADVPDVIAAGRLMHAGDANSISAESVTALGYARDHPSKHTDRNLLTADGKLHL